MTNAVRNTSAEDKITLPITGMSCASCAGRVERALADAQGVREANVNLALENASVSFDHHIITAENLVEIVKNAGYGAQLPDAPVAAETDDNRDLIELAVAAILTAPLLIQMVLMMAGTGLHMPPWAEFALATPIQFYIGRRFYVGAWKALRARSGTMDQLVVMGTGAAYFYSVWILLSRGADATGTLYFEASAVVITLILAGKVMEARAKRSATSALRSLMSLRPDTVRVIRDGAETTIPVAEVRLGESVVLLPGDRLAVDGEIVDGTSTFDEALVTGEPMPVSRGPGDTVIAGSINGSGRITVQANRIGDDTTLARIAKMVADAQTGKAPIQKLVDRISAIFVPAVLVIAVLTFTGWMLAGSTFEPALVAAISVLVIACPCALGLATPTALVAGTGAAARAGILIKDIDTLERAGHVNMVVFDKTGTLTRGKPEIVDIVALEGTNDDLLALAAGVQLGSEHPLGRATVEHAKSRGIAPLTAQDIQADVGSGIAGTIDGKTVRIGKREFAAPNAAQPDAADALRADGNTVVWVGVDGTAVGLIAFSDQPRDDAKTAIAALKSRGVRVAMLTGDNAQTAKRIADDLGLEDVKADVRPEDKAAAIRDWTRDGFKVAMVGDGINDAPALATAELGIAMGTGTDVALETAGVALMRPKPSLVDAALDISRATGAKIRQNLFWAFAYNLVLIPVAALGMLSPMLAGLAMALSSVCVVGNSLLLKRWRSAS